MGVIINDFEIVPVDQEQPRQSSAEKQPARGPKKPTPPDPLRAAMRQRAERRERVRAH